MTLKLYRPRFFGEYGAHREAPVETGGAPEAAMALILVVEDDDQGAPHDARCFAGP